MKFTHASILAVALVVIAVFLAGCASTTPSTPAATPAAGGAASAGAAATPAAAAATAAASSGSSGSAVSGSDLFGGLSYNWVEYKMSTGSGDSAMTVYYKYNKQTGKCSMRFEGAAASQMPSGMQEMDCSSKGTSSTDPNQVSSDAKVTCSPIDETVTVPAGTFSATKCTVTAQGTTSTVWVVKNKFMVKMEGGSTEGGSMEMVLNQYG